MVDQDLGPRGELSALIGKLRLLPPKEGGGNRYHHIDTSDGTKVFAKAVVFYRPTRTISVVEGFVLPPSSLWTEAIGMSFEASTDKTQYAAIRGPNKLMEAYGIPSSKEPHTVYRYRDTSGDEQNPVQGTSRRPKIADFLVDIKRKNPLFAAPLSDDGVKAALEQLNTFYDKIRQTSRS